ncbi:MAG TPA: glycosyltransferase family 2 protein [Actinomycetota bacterium]
MTITTAERSSAADTVRTPSVLVVLVARNAARWLRECLQSLAAQTHTRLGVLAVDNASTDETNEILQQALGEARVVTLDENRGLAGALRVAVGIPAAGRADYLLVLHDDIALAPDAVARLVEAAEGIEGVERVGVVGPKVVDWEDPRLLREVGRSTDRFGHPYSPLQEGELDQGQYDRVLEVLFVSSCAMLISREALRRTGAFDERYGGHHDDLDFCWRARLAGFRVLMTPLAVVRHRDATVRGERGEEHRRRSARYYAERAGLASMLKDYGVPTLLWLFPVYLALGAARLVFLALSRRFEDAIDLLTAWGWNLMHLPGTLRRRVRAQSVRSVRDRAVRRFMAATFRMPRWFERAEEFLDEGLEELEAAEDGRPLPRRAASVAVGHPVLIASVVAIAVGALALRHYVGPDGLAGGALAAFPPTAEHFFRELLSGVRTTVLGGAQPASPALAGLGALSWASFGSTALAQKVLLAALPPLAAILLYRALARQTARPGSAVVGAGAYLVSGVSLWAFSEGRISLLVVLAVLPVAWDRLDAAFSRRGPDRPLRFGVGFGVAVAIGVSAEAGILLPLASMATAHLLAGRRRGRGAALSLLAVAAAALLAFPVVGDAVAAPAATLSSFVGTHDAWSVLRLAPGGGPGTWAAAFFLPIAAGLGLAAVGSDHRGRAWRAAFVALSSLALAWASAAGYLPEALTNAPVYLAGSAVAMAAIVSYGTSSLLTELERHAFGLRQVGAALMTVVLAVGLGAQSLQVALAAWEVGPGGLPPAWPVIDSSAPGEFRILWVGAPTGERLPAPGGDPRGVIEAGEASVRYTITDRHGATALDTGREGFGPGYVYLRRALDELFSGHTGHAGALLAPLGVRFVVAEEGDLPSAARSRLDAQTDLDRVPAGGLTIFRNARALPTAFVPMDPAWTEAPRNGDLVSIAERPPARVHRLPPPEAGSRGTAEIATEIVVADQRDEGWRVRSRLGAAEPHRAFGWAMAAAVEAGPVSVSYTDQWMRTVEIVVLGVLWLAALWITRKPGSA